MLVSDFKHFSFLLPLKSCSPSPSPQKLACCKVFAVSTSCENLSLYIQRFFKNLQKCESFSLVLYNFTPAKTEILQTRARRDIPICEVDRQRFDQPEQHLAKMASESNIFRMNFYFVFADVSNHIPLLITNSLCGLSRIA